MPKALTTTTAVALTGLLAAGIGFTVVDSHQTRTSTAQAAQDYTPAVTYTAPAGTPEVAFIGDSFTAGAGSTHNKHRWTTKLAQTQGWIELNYGRGGTNYATGRKATNAKPYKDSLNDLIISQPDIVIVSSGGNSLDTNQIPAARETFRTLRDALPDARLVATSPMFRAHEMPPRLIRFGEDIQREVEAAGGQYLDIGNPLLGHPEAMAADDVHPNDTGHRIIADAVSRAADEAGL